MYTNSRFPVSPHNKVSHPGDIGYSKREIGEHFGLHYSKINKILGGEDLTLATVKVKKPLPVNNPV